MKLYKYISSLFGKCCFLFVGLSLLCLSCNEKPKFKKKHYTTKRIVRHYKRNDSMLATTDTKKPTVQKDTKIQKEIIIPPKPRVEKKVITEKKPVTKEKVKSQNNTINIIKKRQNKYYIIAASYSLEPKARELALQYKELGFPVEIISANGKFRVALNSDMNKLKAIKLRDNLRIKLNKKDLWLLKY